MFGLLFTVGCADYSLPDDAYLLDDGRHDDDGDVTLRVACIHDNMTSWRVTCHKGKWTTEPETAAVDCAHARVVALGDLSSAVRVADSSSTNQGSFFTCLAFSLAAFINILSWINPSAH